MLKKLDWYILRKFFSSFIFSILLLTFITVVIDISEKADDFVKSGVSTRDIIVKYYFGFIPHIVSMLFPLFVFISVIFFTSKMAGRSEIVAILASGTSFKRFLRPYWVGALILGLALWLALRYMVPNAQLSRTRFESQYINTNAPTSLTGISTLYFRNDTTHYGQISYFDTATKRGSNFSLQHIVGNKMVENLRGETLIWDTAKKKWKLEGVILRTIDSLNRETISQKPEEYINLNFKPSEMVKDQFTKNIMQTPELERFIQREKLRGSEGINDFIVERHRRDATPVSLILLTLIGVSVASRKVRGGSGLHLALGIVLAALYILTDRFSTIFSTKGNFPPMLAAWTPNIIFLFVAIYMYRKAPK